MPGTTDVGTAVGRKAGGRAMSSMERGTGDRSGQERAAPEDQRSLQTLVVKLILGVFGAMTVFLAGALFYIEQERLSQGLAARAQLIGQALQLSNDLHLGVVTGNRSQLRQGLEPIKSIDELVHVLVVSPTGDVLAGVSAGRFLEGDELQQAVAQPGGWLEVRHELPLADPARATARAGAAAADDVLAQINAEEEKPKDEVAAPVSTGRLVVHLSGLREITYRVSGVLALGLLLCLSALVALLLIARGTFARVRPALEHANRMSRGDFTTSLEGDFRELSTLFSALNRISASLSTMIDDVRGLSDEVTDAVERIRSESGALRSGADQGKSSVAVTESAVVAMGKGVAETASKLKILAKDAEASATDTATIAEANRTSGHAVGNLKGEVERAVRSIGVVGDKSKNLTRDARALSDAAGAARAAGMRMQKSLAEATDRAENGARLADLAMRESSVGGKAIEDSVARINEISMYSSTMEENLAGLTEQVEGMTPVLGAIADVTSRTSLLALNAGIIAAQAGEKGHAFQVVVEELKALAARTSQLTSTVERSVHTVLEERGKTTDAAVQLRRVVLASIEDAQRAGSALSAIRGSTAESQTVSAAIAEMLKAQNKDVVETLSKIDVVDGAGRSVEGTATALTDETKVLREVADRFSVVVDEVVKTSRAQGDLAQQVGAALSRVAEQVMQLSVAQETQLGDVARVERSLEQIKVFADNAKQGSQALEDVVLRLRAKAAGLSEGLHRFRTRTGSTPPSPSLPLPRSGDPPALPPSQNGARTRPPERVLTTPA